MTNKMNFAEFELCYAQGINKLAKVLMGSSNQAVLQQMVQVIGSTLDVDRTLVYDIDFKSRMARGLCEWLNPKAEGIEPSVATYPLEVFIGGAEYVRRTRKEFVSHAGSIHHALSEDGSGDILHGAMCIQSLLWFPFDFEADRFMVLVFNQVRSKREWTERDLRFVNDIAELVSLSQIRRRFEERRSEERELEYEHTRLEALGLLAGGVAHDFNNLLAAIMGNAELIRMHQDGDQGTEKRIDRILNASMVASSMCRQLLTYSGHVEPELERIDINQVLQQALGMVEDGFEQYKFVREFSAAPVAVMGDRLQLQKLAINLVTNAAQAVAGNSGMITIRSGMTTRSEIPDGVKMRSDGPRDEGVGFFQVQDNGIGMDDVAKARIFEPFYSTKGTGHGLGLATAHGILDGHGAGIRVESEVGKGTTFTVFCPKDAGVSLGPIDDPDSAAASLKRLEVLVVDGEPLVQSVCESTLALAGFHSSLVRSGEQALTACAERTLSFQVVIMEVGLPGIDGCQTLMALRKGGYNFPVILIGDQPMTKSLMDDGFDYGVWTYLKKPFRPSVLVECVETICAG